ncbi:DNA topoisomerase IB [soil metagenome]
MQLEASAKAAKHAALLFTNARSPGLRRAPRGKGFVYLTAIGRPASRADAARIAALVIPPAWRNVWICPDPRGHLQATGIDVRGRKQYRYHEAWTAQRNASKFTGLAALARVLPALRRRVTRDLKLDGMPKDRVLACIVHLMDAAYIRVGNSTYARANESYGLTTIHNNHALVRGAEIKFNFRAKSGKQCAAHLHDPAAAVVVRRCQHLPGQELFAFQDDKGKTHDVTSTDVNEYLNRISRLHITAKDFRTWGGTTIAAETLLSMEPPDPRSPLPERELHRREVAAVRAAATALGNTMATCRKFYVHSGLMEAYRMGRLSAAAEATRRTPKPRELHPAERAIANLLRSGGLNATGAAALG